jgi:hypothetical protein
MRTSFLIAAGMAAYLFSSPANAAVVEEFQARDWSGLALTNDETGVFSHCSVYAEYQNGATLYLSFEASQDWYLSVTHNDWSLTEGAQYAFIVRVDRRAAIDGTAVALASHQLGVSIDSNDPFIGQIRRGNLLTFTFQNTEYSFELSNSDYALEAAQDCVRRHLAADTRTPPVGQAVPRADAPEPAPAPQAVTPPGPSPQSGPSAAEGGHDLPASPFGEQQNFGPWVVTAAGDPNNNFVNCTAYGVHGDDQIILSYFPDGVWTFGLYRGGWKLSTEETYYLWYNIDAPADGAGVIKRPVEAVEPTRIFFEVSEMEEIIERMADGSQLNLQLRGLSMQPESYSYSLDQAAEAFEATRACVQNNVGSTVAANAGDKESSGQKEEPVAALEEEEPAAPEEPVDEPDVEEEVAEELTSDRARPNFGDEMIEALTVPGWEAGAFADADGTFTHCAIRAEYQNDTTLAVGQAASDEIVMALARQDWESTTGDWVPVVLTLTGDATTTHEVEGEFVGPELVVMNLGLDGAFYDALYGASQLTVEVNGKTLAFDISDIAPGLDAIDDCVESHNAAAETPPAPAGKRTEAPAAPEQPEVAGKSTVTPEPHESDADALPDDADIGAAMQDLQTLAEGLYTMGILMGAGFMDAVELEEGAEVPVELPESATRWQVGEVFVVTRSMPGPLDGVKSVIAEQSMERCDGSMTSEDVEADGSGNARMDVMCGEEAKVIHYVLLSQENGDYMVFAILGPEPGGAAEDVAAKAYKAALQT